jgi:hypothetical protein
MSSDHRQRRGGVLFGHHGNLDSPSALSFALAFQVQLSVSQTTCQRVIFVRPSAAHFGQVFCIAGFWHLEVRQELPSHSLAGDQSDWRFPAQLAEWHAQRSSGKRVKNLAAGFGFTRPAAGSIFEIATTSIGTWRDI